MTELASVAPWNEGPPKILSPAVFGAGIYSPFFYPICTAGQRALTYEVEGLPDGLSIINGVIRGAVTHPLETTIQIRVKNNEGADEKSIKIIVGGKLALTPPMGWNSWNVWGPTVDQEKIRGAVDLLISSGLAARGYSYVNIDDGWQGQRAQNQSLQPNEKFPDIKSLCDTIHSKGLRAGIYSSPWGTTYAGYLGGSNGNGREIGPVTYEKEDAREWAMWGFDYLKYDWCPIDLESVQRMSDALKSTGRDIVLSLSNSTPFSIAPEIIALAHCWRTSGDVWDHWNSISGAFYQKHWAPFGGQGHWNDCDMLVVGNLGWGELHPTRLTQDEQITHMTLWCMLASPLFIGCDLSKLDDFTLRLLSNEEVLAIDQDPLGKPARCVREDRYSEQDGTITQFTAVYVRELSDGRKAVAFFNRGSEDRIIEISWKELGISGRLRARDLWMKKELGWHTEKFSVEAPSHGARLIALFDS